MNRIDDGQPVPAKPTGRRGRPSRAEEQVITRAIVDAALALFLADGYGATSMKRVSEAAAVAPNTLYARFPEKSVLFRAIVEWQVASWQERSPPRRAPAGAPLQAILEACALGMMEALEDGEISALTRLLAQEASRFPELAGIWYDSTVRIFEEEVHDRVASAPDRAFAPEDVRDIIATLVEAVIGHMHQRVLVIGSPEPDGLTTAAARIARVVARGWTRHAG
ncbi:TetR/AcrR family transcriptional regulator [Sphingomonas sp. RP10(2022)]|uniref:TetR/AcrR family transcriptional regulator n=1 Tax=Sphingomonas liriopis TaxID=2949094 RepID=A0A9X2HSG2_9SPHN|nr:TetR/AcrR family transcriptional regulator [Sphingomonas liriopis]MCP3733476.1 TetR/AcrR family transcriptional regulator [Sphingomonas liriopis]